MMHDDQNRRLPAVPPWRDEPLVIPPQTFEDSAIPHMSQTYAEQSASRSIGDYLQAFRERKLMLGCFLAVGFLVGLASVIPKPLTYSSETSLEIQGLNENFMNLNQVDPQAAAGLYSASASNILTQVEVLNSNALRQRVVERLERELIPGMPPSGSGLAGVFNRIRSFVGIGPESPVDAMREAIRTAASTRQARALEGTRIVRIRCESTNPDVAAEFLNVMVAEYTEQSLESRARSSRTTNQWLDSQLQEQKQKLEEAETRLKDFVARAGVQGLTQQEQGSTLAASRLAQLQQELATIQSDRIVRQSRYEVAISKGPEALPEVMGASMLPQFRATLIELERQKAQLVTRFKPAHPRVRQVQAQIDEVNQNIEVEKKQVLERLKNDLDAASRREQLLGRSFTSETGTIQGQADKILQYNLLRRDVESSRQIYNGILQQVNQSGIATAVPTQSVRVVDGAVPSFAASLRSVYIGGGLGLMSGLLFGCVLAVMFHQAEMRFYKPGDPVSVLKLPELGVIPSSSVFERKHRFRDLAERIHLKQGARKGKSLLSDGIIEVAPSRVELITHEQRPSMMAESFRAVLTSILFAPQHLQPRTLTITSANPQEGKSTVTSNLAISLAEMGRRVLLVDCDLRRPRQHEVFNVENTWGLSDLLAEETLIDAYPIEALARETVIPKLFLLTSGPPLQNVTSQIHSGRFRDLLERVKSEFDYVLIDTAPLMLVPDARIVGQLSDGVILVLRSGRTLQADAIHVARRLKDDGTRILGTILNSWVPQGGGKKGYEKYYRDYQRSDR
jgi:polysaccharide biosynthesis transport protein